MVTVIHFFHFRNTRFWYVKSFTNFSEAKTRPPNLSRQSPFSLPTKKTKICILLQRASLVLEENFANRIMDGISTILFIATKWRKSTVFQNSWLHNIWHGVLGMPAISAGDPLSVPQLSLNKSIVTILNQIQIKCSFKTCNQRLLTTKYERICLFASRILQKRICILRPSRIL